MTDEPQQTDASTAPTEAIERKPEADAPPVPTTDEQIAALQRQVDELRRALIEQADRVTIVEDHVQKIGSQPGIKLF